MVDSNEPEHDVITSTLEVERLDTNLFRSKSLSIPFRGRGVFGGQVISQALVSATECVDPVYGLHSLHCYFLLSAAANPQILYYVERLREGRSYTTRSVKAVQNGHVIFIMLCSFHKPEPLQPSHQWSMPFQLVPRPEDCELDEVIYSRMAAQEKNPKLKDLYSRNVEDRIKSPLAVKSLKEYVAPDGNKVFMHWLQAKGIAKYEVPFQKCILGYMSDIHFINSAQRALGLERYGKGPNAVGMTSSLDHSIWFYDDNFDCSDWILYVVTSPRTGSGRGVVHGRMFSSSGTLVAITTQEGVVRADIGRPPKDENPTAKSKL